MEKKIGQKSLFKQKYNIVKDYLNEERDPKIKEKNESIKINHSETFYKDVEEIKNENESKKIPKILLKKFIIDKKEDCKRKMF